MKRSPIIHSSKTQLECKSCLLLADTYRYNNTIDHIMHNKNLGKTDKNKRDHNQKLLPKHWNGNNYLLVIIFNTVPTA